VAIVDSLSIWSSKGIVGWYGEEVSIDAVDWHVLWQQSFLLQDVLFPVAPGIVGSGSVHFSYQNIVIFEPGSVHFSFQNIVVSNINGFNLIITRRIDVEGVLDGHV